MIIFFLSNVRLLACARVCPSPESRKQDIRKWCSEDPLPCVQRSSYTYTCLFLSSAACRREWIGLALVGSAASVRGCTQLAPVISATGKRIGCANKGTVSRAGLVVGLSVTRTTEKPLIVEGASALDYKRNLVPNRKQNPPRGFCCRPIRDCRGPACGM